MKHSQITILGAGPIGIEAALACLERGWNVTIYERGNVGENLQKWGHVRLFSPFQLNHSPRGARKLRESGRTLPDEEALLLSDEYINEYLKPLSEIPEIAEVLETQTTVRHISRDMQLKGDHIGSEQRADSPFRLLLESEGIEKYVTADFVLDCTGTFGNHNWLGRGGIPCLGERKFADRIRYDLPDLLNKDRQNYSGLATLVVGSGYSAATNIVSLASLRQEAPSTTLYWVTRKTGDAPLTPIPEDALPERKQLTQRANQLASQSSDVNWIGGAVVDSILAEPESNQLKVTLVMTRENTTRTILVDRILANVGFHPERSIYEELQIHECYASHGPMKLAAALMGESSADCLTQASPGASTLINPEPNFFILGSKSYGRSSRFLLKVGLEQVDQIVDLIAKK
ncbi:NAD(P)/FAD-dependent oxidoreductase [Thalassoglobus polymorphus]|nr:hypothetical protein [Thalassoglobus polymorphus]